MKTSGARHSAREYALRALYGLDLLNQTGEEHPRLDRPNWWGNEDRLHVGREGERFALRLIREALERRVWIDQQIRECAHHWRLERMSSVDRNILRLAIGELLLCLETPIRVILDEALELAKGYGDEESARFVNGILDPLARQIRDANREP